MTMERELLRIAPRYDPPTPVLVTLVMKYHWAPDPVRMKQLRQWPLLAISRRTGL